MKRLVVYVSFLLAFFVLTSSALASPQEVTFNKDVLPILQKNCQVCHRPGEIGPMPLLTYEATRPWAKSIKEAVLTRSMPPWFADPQIGHFANERKLTDVEIKTVVAWVDGGAPEGAPGDRPSPVHWVDGWNIKPDVIYEMPKPYVIPKQGVLNYVYILLPAKFPVDTWVMDGEIQPGNRSMVHHASVIVRPPGSQWMKAAKTGEPYEPGIADGPVSMSMQGFGWLLGYSPGTSPQRYFSPDGDVGRLIPAGSDLFLEMHYTANGTEAQDQTKFGLVLSTKRPKKQLLNLPIEDSTFEIPPNASNYRGSAGVILNEAATLMYVQPHMHLRGIDMKIEIIYPNGQSEMLLSVPHYNFMWQVIYILAKPIQLPKGTQIIVTAHWDNSANNKFNPDPSQTVHPGPQSWDEMLVALLGTYVDTETAYHPLKPPSVN